MGSQAEVQSELPAKHRKSGPWSKESVSLTKRPARNCECRSRRKYVGTTRTPTAFRLTYEKENNHFYRLDHECTGEHSKGTVTSGTSRTTLPRDSQ